MEAYKRISLGLVFLLFSCQSNSLPENNNNSKVVKPVPEVGQDLEENNTFLERDNISPKSSLPRTIKIEMKLYDTKDLKVQTGDKVKAGQVIGDHSIDRQKLLYQKSQLERELSNLSINSLYVPIMPIASLPKANYEIEQSNISMAEYNLSNAKLQHENQRDKISKLRSMMKSEVTNYQSVQNNKNLQLNNNFKPLTSDLTNEVSLTSDLAYRDIDSILQHEESILANLQTKIKSAEIKLNLAKSRLSKAKQDREYQEYLHQLEIYKRSVNLSRQKLELARQEEKVNYQKSQIKSQINQIENQISQLAEVRSPYDGTIKKIKWAGQSNNVINVVVTLAVESNRETSSLSR